MPITQNKKALFDYEILERYQAGVVLYGFETKAIRQGKANMRGSFVIIRGEEAFWVGADIGPYQAKNTPTWYAQDRTRKLLLQKKELQELTGKTAQKGLTLVPVSLYTKGRNIKLEFGLARHKKKHDKRETIKKHEFARKRLRILND